MQNAVSFKRFNSEQHKLRDDAAQESLINQWAEGKKITIVRSFEATSNPDTVFETDAWEQLEAFALDRTNAISHIVVARYNILSKRNMAAVMEKAELFQQLRIRISIASQE